MSWKYSSVGFRSLAKGLATLPKQAEIIAALKPETRAALQNPSSSPWYDGSLVIDLTESVLRLGGEADVEQMWDQSVKRTLGPIVMPFLKVSLALFGAQPGTVLSRMEERTRFLYQGMRSDWQQQPGERRGRFTVTYPSDVVPSLWAAWKGSLRFTLEVCGVTGTITPLKDASTARSIVFELTWQ